MASKSDHVRIEAPGGRLRISLGGETIVDTARALVVHEGSLPPRYYVPREDVRAELQESEQAGACPWKGQWRYLHVRAGGKSATNAAWVYFEPTPACNALRDRVAFSPEKMDEFGWIEG